MSSRLETSCRFIAFSRSSIARFVLLQIQLRKARNLPGLGIVGKLRGDSLCFFGGFGELLLLQQLIGVSSVAGAQPYSHRLDRLHINQRPIGIIAGGRTGLGLGPQQRLFRRFWRLLLYSPRPAGLGGRWAGNDEQGRAPSKSVRRKYRLSIRIFGE